MQSQRDHERLKGSKEKSLFFNSLEPFFMPIKARFHVNWRLHLICDASVENLYEETTTTSSCLTRCSKTKSPHFYTWCGDWVYSKSLCSSQLSDGFKIFRIVADNCNKHPVKRHLLLLPLAFADPLHSAADRQ